jgi:uncharacterized Zn finger protein (UPF0148 family)
MSDEFDKEAEREKLRKKFAEDERKREHTQRLSELLLQGATMTDRHCETCSDPIFRHEGREFCPTCHATEDGYEVPVETPAAADDEGDTAESHATESAAAAESASTTADAGAGVTTDVESPDPAAASESARDEPATDEPTAPTSHVAESEPESAPPESAASFAPSATGAEARRASADVDDMTAARDAIIETLTRFAQAAAETDDPRRARERLATAKEAAKTLAALDR